MSFKETFKTKWDAAVGNERLRQRGLDSISLRQEVKDTALGGAALTAVVGLYAGLSAALFAAPVLFPAIFALWTAADNMGSRVKARQHDEAQAQNKTVSMPAPSA